MLLSNVSIRERLALAVDDPQRLVIDPLGENAIQPCSVDVHLGNRMMRWDGPLVDTRVVNDRWWRPFEPEGASNCWRLVPGRFYLAVLAEVISLPADLCGHLWNVSSVARNGVLPHLAAGLLDPCWTGRATLEMMVVAAPTRVYGGDRIGQVEFLQLDQPANPGYEGRYQGDAYPTPARLPSTT